MSPVNYRRLILMHLGLAYALSAPADSTAEPTDPLYRSVQEAESVDRLPKQVEAKDGELTLFADYNDVREDGIALYLVNRTAARIDFATEDADVHVKLEALSESGRWERAQPVHHFMGCGNSYYVRTLLPGEFFRFLGYQPPDGEHSTIRYRMYTESVNPVSNPGPGHARSAEVAAARSDRLALLFASFDDLRDLALGTTAELGRRVALRVSAVEALRSIPSEGTVAVFETLADDTDKRVREEAIRGLGVFGVDSVKAELRFQALLKDGNVDNRVVAIRTLSERPMSSDVIQFAKRLLDHAEPGIRGAALVVLGKACSKFPEVHKLLVEYGSDPEPSLQRLVENIQKRKLGWCQLEDVKPNGGS